jgi:hypothetical protein
MEQNEVLNILKAIALELGFEDVLVVDDILTNKIKGVILGDSEFTEKIEEMMISNQLLKLFDKTKKGR